MPNTTPIIAGLKPATPPEPKPTPSQDDIERINFALWSIFSYLDHFGHINHLQPHHGDTRELFRDLRGTLNSPAGPMAGIS